MAIAFLHFMANLIIALALLRLIQSWIIGAYGDDSAVAKGLAFIQG